VAFLGKTGCDNFSELISETLEKKRVDTGFIIASEQYSTGLTVVLNYDMDRANITYPGAMEHLVEADISEEVLQRARHLHVSSIFLQSGLAPGITRLFKRAKKLGLTTSLDPQWDPAEKWDLDLDALLPHLDVFMPNAQEFLGLTHSKDIGAGLNKITNTRSVISIKDGINGSYLWNGKELIAKPAFLNSEVVDCIGAGDSFDAGFIHEFVKGGSWERCLEVGNIMGAINTLAAGGTTAFSTRDEIKKTALERYSFAL
jgi:sugar/nucleoside kinase (ribokinase family)